MTAIGIDLGTSNSVAALVHNDQVVVIANAENSETTPSVVYEGERGEWIVGAAAMALTSRRLDQTGESSQSFCFSSVKRLLGRKVDDPVVREVAARVPFEIEPAQDGGAWLKGRSTLHACEAVQAKILIKLRQAAERFLHKKNSVKSCVIAAPAHFTTEQISRTIDSALIAGLEVLQIIPEPTAAALAAGLDQEPGSLLAVFDLGAGTFDISIVQVRADGIETLATAGDDFLGGDDFDAAIAQWVEQECQRVSPVPPSDVRRHRLISDARTMIKERLSFESSVAYSLNYAGHRDGGTPVSWRLDVSRADLERVCGPLIERCRAPCERALKAAGLEAGQITRLLLVGGQTRTPAVAALARSMFPNARPVPGTPEKLVAIGAARLAAALAAGDGSMLRDVTPHAVAVQRADGELHEIIAAQTSIPVRRSFLATTRADHQEAVTVRLLQGEARHLLGQLHLELPRRLPAGKARVDVTVEIDASGRTFVTAADADTGRKAAEPMAMAGGLDKRAIKRLVDESKRQFIDRAIDVPPEPEPKPEPESELSSLLSQAFGEGISEADMIRLADAGLVVRVGGEWEAVNAETPGHR